MKRQINELMKNLLDEVAPEPIIPIMKQVKVKRDDGKILNGIQYDGKLFVESKWNRAKVTTSGMKIEISRGKRKVTLPECAQNRKRKDVENILKEMTTLKETIEPLPWEPVSPSPKPPSPSPSMVSIEALIEDVSDTESVDFSSSCGTTDELLADTTEEDEEVLIYSSLEDNDMDDTAK